MSSPQHAFVAAHYGPRANDYVTSLTHSTGDDLEQLEALLRGHAGARVLDLGCGGGHVSYRASPHVARVIACDLTPDMLEAVERTAAARGLSNIAVQQAAAEALPFEDRYFDFVLCRFSVHHWHDMEAGLREARRVLKPGGRAVFIDTVAPADPFLDTHLQTVELLRDSAHVRNYSISEWITALSRARFAVTGLISRRLKLDFPAWIARTRTPSAHVDVIRSVQDKAPQPVHDHFAITDDGSFTLDTMAITAVPA